MSFKRQKIALLIGASILLGSGFILTVCGLPIFAGGSHVNATGKGLSEQGMGEIEATVGIIQQRFFTAVDQERLVNGAVHGMIATLGDPYTTFMEKEQAEQFKHFVNGFFYGIGVTMTMQDKELVVVSCIKGSPAEKAGMKPQDMVLSVNDETTHGKNINEAVAKIRGPKGTTVKISIKRVGLSKPLEIAVVRGEIDEESVDAKMLPGKIGYIQIRQFVLNTFERFKDQLDKLEGHGLQGLIIDVRHNPGGVLEVAQKMTELLVPKGKLIVQIENRNEERDRYHSQGAEQRKPYPVTVLINKGSASAAEVMASALQESAGAKLVGEATFGKGTIQESYKFNDGGIVKITVAKWLTPNGNWIHKKGIQPDIRVKPSMLVHVCMPILKQEVLKFDMNDTNVKNMQLILKGLGYKPGREDGYFSQGTVAAVKAFQHDYKLTVTGMVDEKTAHQLEQTVMEVVHDPKNDAQLHTAIESVTAGNGLKGGEYTGRLQAFA